MKICVVEKILGGSYRGLVRHSFGYSGSNPLPPTKNNSKVKTNDTTMRRVIALLFATILFSASSPIESSVYEYDVFPLVGDKTEYIEMIVSATDKEGLITYYAPQGNNIALTKSSHDMLEKIMAESNNNNRVIILVCDVDNLSTSSEVAKKICKKIKQHIHRRYKYPMHKIKIMMIDYN